MPANTPNVGVRALFDPTDTASVMIANMSTIGGVFTPATDIDRTYFPADTPVSFRTSDATALAAVGTSGTLAQTVNQIIEAGIDATITAVVPNILATDTATQQMAKMVGVPASWTGAWALTKAQQETGVRPGILIAPGFTTQRPGNMPNPVMTAFDAICDKLGIAVAIGDAPSANMAAALLWAADFSTSMNVIANAQGAAYSVGGLPVNFDSAAAIAALMIKTDMDYGAPYYNPGNQALTGILGPSRSVEFNPADPSCEANTLLQGGCNCIVNLATNRVQSGGPSGKTFWGFLNTYTDPNWRMINVIRTRKAIIDALPRALLKYIGQNLGPALVTVIVQSIQAFLSELAALPVPAVLPGSQVYYDPTLNDAAGLRVGGLVIDAKWAETPALLDLQLYTASNPASFTILSSQIQAALTQAGVQGTLPAAA
jgi:phage tail sheath protein FI